MLRRLFNLCIVVLVAVNSRLIIENLMKYGWLIKYDFWFSSKSLRDWPLFMCCLSLGIFPPAAFFVEKLAYQKSISERVVVLLHIIITTTAFFYPVLVILRCDSAFVSGVTLMLLTCIVWLKLVSYVHTNYDMRALTVSNEKGEVLPNTLNMEYPYSVSFKSLAYFMAAPTLCYQPSYPRTPSVRKGWVFRQLIKLIIFTGVMGFIIEQYMNPIVQNSQHPLKGNLLYAMERVLKLSVPNVYVWLCMFYCFFHLWYIFSVLWFNLRVHPLLQCRLNILAELLRFGDREFYKDWWNAKTVEDPVHKWMVRHVYFPCIRIGLSKSAAIFIAFLLSAVFHELCIAIPCHMFKLWAFIGIMFQVKVYSHILLSFVHL
ncbi:Diacylglycerol O-acyltransferase 1C [Lupinus albus]|uniref:diacylglycerol O-acyltransferase n=1 Tax=Lupinus albus TaxID=3870 RepID=A0A6A4PTR9_LUPAL|nr:Diacylglycerol O-acyltransferase 1C [Lupinus albus]